MLSGATVNEASREPVREIDSEWKRVMACLRTVAFEFMNEEVCFNHMVISFAIHVMFIVAPPG